MFLRFINTWETRGHKSIIDYFITNKKTSKAIQDIRVYRSTELDSYQYLLCKGKGKAVPLQAWSGPEGSRKLRLPDFMTTTQDDGKVVSLRHRPHLPPGDTPGTHFC